MKKKIHMSYMPDTAGAIANRLTALGKTIVCRKTVTPHHNLTPQKILDNVWSVWDAIQSFVRVIVIPKQNLHDFHLTYGNALQ